MFDKITVNRNKRLKNNQQNRLLLQSKVCCVCYIINPCGLFCLTDSL